MLLALIGTVMVSYTRARAESIDVECRVGLMERGERMLVLIPGASWTSWSRRLGGGARGANATAVHRIAHTWRADPPCAAPDRRDPRASPGTPADDDGRSVRDSPLRR